MECELTSPKGLSTKKEASFLEISKPWFTFGNLFIVLLMIAITVIVFLSIPFIVSEAGALMLIPVILVSIFLLWGTHHSLVSCINKTVILVTNTNVTISQGPLRSKSTEHSSEHWAKLTQNEYKSYKRTKRHNGTYGSKESMQYNVQYVTEHGQTGMLIDRLDTFLQASFIEFEIQKFLGIGANETPVSF